MPPGWDVFPEPVPDGSFPERSVGHGKTGPLRVGGTADFGMPRRSTERPETGRKLPHCQLGHAGVELRRGNGGSLNRTVSAAIGGNIAPWRTIGGVGGGSAPGFEPSPTCCLENGVYLRRSLTFALTAPAGVRWNPRTPFAQARASLPSAQSDRSRPVEQAGGP